ncbi:sugar 3,4-ketoisomerase [Aliikangiella sp. IMCC44359]|uniref:sugar 3,4-ketoisomerase n=1 Tax=Aliikangiella sp. IMCC44359 TaxID=3459125 RepID=UPI00403A97A9
MDIISHNVLGDDRGHLIAIEGARDIPFNIERVFYIYGTDPQLPRGQHAHYETKQYLIAVNGQCKVTLENGNLSKTFLLDHPSKGLLQDAMIWGTMHDFSKDCVLLVFADRIYDAKDYIFDYQKFLDLCEGDG